MTLSQEATYLYIYSKELLNINRRLKKLSGSAEKQIHKHSMARTEEKRQKHKIKHLRISLVMERLIRDHNRMAEKLHHHYSAFSNELKKEHLIKK